MSPHHGAKTVITKWILALAVVATAFALLVAVLPPLTVSADPNHFAGDYVLFAKAGAAGITDDRKAFEPVCDGGNDGSGETSGEGNFYFGRIHSNADLKLNGANTFTQTISPDTEITYGVNEPETCQLQSDIGNVFQDGMPLNITGSGDATSVQGPYQIGVGGWPGNLGTFLTQDVPPGNPDAFETFQNTTPTSAIGLTCDTIGTAVPADPLAGQQTTLTSALSIDITFANAANYEGRVICNGNGVGGKISISANLLGIPAGPLNTPPAVPFRITMLSHGLIETPGQNNVLAPALDGHGILAWTDVAFTSQASGIKINGSNIDVPERSILFAPRSGVDVSGSNDNDVCIQAIGQGIVKVAGSNSRFGPFGPNCGGPASVVTDIHVAPHTSLGQSGAVEVGTQVHDKVTVSSSSGDPLTGTMDFRRFNTGNCQAPVGEEQLDVDIPGTPVSHEFEDILPFTSLVAGVFSYRAEYNGDVKNLAAESPCEGPIRFVDAFITIDPPTGTNAVGSPHTLTGHVEVNDGTGFVNAPAGTTITFAIVSGTGTLGPPATCNTIGVTGSCTVNLTNSAAGVDVVSASTSVDVSGVSLSRSTNGNAGPGGSGNARKTWVDVRILINPEKDANEVNTNHVLTITLEKSVEAGVWTPLIGETVSASLINTNGATADFVPPAANSCTTQAPLGQCTVTIKSTTAGTTTVEGTWAGGTVDGATFGAKATNPDAVKVWVNVRILIGPNGTNEVGKDHALTITLQQSVEEGEWTALNGQTVSAQIFDTNGATANFVPLAANSCVTQAPLGQCVVTINSPTAGTSTVEATWAGGTVAGATIGVRKSNPDAVKTWVNLRISLSPLAAFNQVGQAHTITAFVEKHEGGGAGWVAVGGATVTFSEVSDTATSDFVPPGANTCVTVAVAAPPLDVGECSITINSLTAGTVVIKATTTVTVLTVEITRTTGTPANTAAGGSGNASKTWGSGGALWLLIDEDSIDNGIRFHDNPTIGQQNIFPETLTQFSDVNVNDQKASYTMRDVLQYFIDNVGKTIALMTGQTGDEGWFAPNCVPLKWSNGTNGNCAANGTTPSAQFTQGLANFLAGTVPQSKLDNIKDVRPLRARGIEMLEGQTVCAIVYDSDISINYRTSAPYQIGNLQGATLGVVAFTVLDNGVNQMLGFSSSTLPEAQILIQNAGDVCVSPLKLFGAPIPKTSSVPNDINPHSTADDVGYRAPVPPAPPIP